jgi:hypothetical protein
MNTQEAEKWLKDNGFSNACIRIDEYHRPDLYVSDVLIKYAQQQVKNLNIPAVIKSVCENCSNTDFNETMGCRNYLQGFKCENFKQTGL